LTDLSSNRSITEDDGGSAGDVIDDERALGQLYIFADTVFGLDQLSVTKRTAFKWIACLLLFRGVANVYSNPETGGGGGGDIMSNENLDRFTRSTCFKFPNHDEEDMLQSLSGNLTMILQPPSSDSRSTNNEKTVDWAKEFYSAKRTAVKTYISLLERRRATGGAADNKEPDGPSKNNDGGGGGGGGGGRRKRDTSSTDVSVSDLQDEEEELPIVVDPSLLETAISLYESSLVGSDVIGEARDEDIDRLMSKVDSSQKALCTGISAAAAGNEIATDMVNTIVYKTGLDAFADVQDMRFSMKGGGGGGDGDASKVTLPEELAANYSRWRCGGGGGGGGGGGRVCNGVCVALTILTEDFPSATSPDLENDPPHLATKVYDWKILDPVKGENVDFASSKSLVGDPVTMVLQVDPERKARAMSVAKAEMEEEDEEAAAAAVAAEVKDLQVKCMVYYLDKWNLEKCRTLHIKTSADGSSAFVTCSCDVSGPVAVGLVSSGDPVVQLPEVYVFSETITFKIDADYAKVVGNEAESKAAFVKTMRSQLSTRLSCDSCVKRLDVRPGSIVVEAEVATSDPVEAGELKVSYDDLKKAVEAGDLVLLDDKGNRLPVPPQKTDGAGPGSATPTPQMIEEEDLVPMILLAIGLAIFLIVIVCLIIAICLKKKKQKEKVSQLAVVTPGAPPPLMNKAHYMSLGYADTLEGTPALNSIRSSPATAGLGGGVASAVTGSNSSAVLLQELADEDDVESGRDQPVPVTPARYVQPTKDQVDQTQTLSPEAMQEIERKVSAPNTPPTVSASRATLTSPPSKH